MEHTITLVYRIFNLCLSSNIPLPELPACTDSPDIRFALVNQSPEGEMQDIRWLHHWHTPDGELFSSCGITNGRLILAFPGMADFYISADQKVVQCCAKANVPEHTIRHLLIDQVIPRILGHWGSLVVHGSAVTANGKAIAFIGQSGLGKSTLAAYFYLKGHALLTDDCFEINGLDDAKISIVPNYSGVRLLKDSLARFTTVGAGEHVAHYSSKQRITLGSDNSNRSWPLAAIFFLTAETAEPSQSIKITPIDGLQRTMKVVQGTFGLYAGIGDELPNHFFKQGSLSNSPISFFELNYPRCYDQLPEVRQRVLSALVEEH